MMELSPFEFDQTGKGWRSLEDPALQVLAIKEYIDKYKEDDFYTRLLNFHLGQALAMRNLDENDKIYAVHHMRLSLEENNGEWNDYVNATIAFLEKNREELDKYVGKQNYNDHIIDRLRKNFDKEYRDAY